MNVLYDISIPGRGQINPAGRTGIFRVVESLAEELIQQPDCNITFCTNSKWEDIALAKAYLAGNSKLANIPFSYPVNYTGRNNTRMQLAALDKALTENRNQLSVISKALFRIRHKELKYREKFLSRAGKQFLHPSDLKRADVYHSHFFPSFSGVKEAGIKSLFLTCYDIIPILYPQFCEEEMQVTMLNILNKLTPDTWIVCISEATRNDLLNYMGNRLDAGKVSVTPLAASSNFYQSTDKIANRNVLDRYGIPDAPYILSLCTLEPRKNIDQAIRAFVQLMQQENLPDLNLVLVGTKGWKAQKIFESIAAGEQIKERIYITGFVADEDLSAIYSNALMFVYPSFYEGFGLPPLEAMQCGVPVITSNTSSLPEVAGNAGIMVSPTHLDELCQAMLSVYNSGALRNKMIAASLQRASQFSWKRCAEKTVAAYKTALQW